MTRNLTQIGLHKACGLGLLALSVLGVSWAPLQVQAQTEPSAARVWNETLLDAIRNDLARPTVHARNLHHWSVACYDAWAAYDSVATPFLIDVNVEPIADPVARRQAQETAMNYASYRLLWNRFLNSPGGSSTLMSFYQTFIEAGGVNSFQSTDVQEVSRIGQPHCRTSFGVRRRGREQ